MPYWNLATTSSSTCSASYMAMEPANRCWVIFRAAERFGIATRIHSGNTLPWRSFRKHSPATNLRTLKRVFQGVPGVPLQTDKVKIFYLVTPDSATPIESTLSAVQELHDEGLFEEFGLSNFSAWQVAEASEIAARHGLDKAERATRECTTRSRVRLEPELFKCLRQLRHPFPCLQSACRWRFLQQEFCQ